MNKQHAGDSGEGYSFLTVPRANHEPADQGLQKLPPLSRRENLYHAPQIREGLGDLIPSEPVRYRI